MSLSLSARFVRYPHMIYETGPEMTGYDTEYTKYLVYSCKCRDEEIGFVCTDTRHCDPQFSLTSTPVKPRAASIFWVILNGTLSGTLRLFPFSKQTL